MIGKIRADKVRRVVDISVSVLVESGPERLAHDVLRQVEEAIAGGLEKAPQEMWLRKTHQAAFGEPSPIWEGDDE
jgi:hypothetical protein